MLVAFVCIYNNNYRKYIVINYLDHHKYLFFLRNAVTTTITKFNMQDFKATRTKLATVMIKKKNHGVKKINIS